MFKGYCFTEVDGSYLPGVSLTSPKEVWNYVSLHRKMYPEIRIVDEEDYVVLHVIHNEIVFPLELVGK